MSIRSLIPALLLVLLVTGALSAETSSSFRSPEWREIDGVSPPPTLRARAALLADLESGTVLHEKNSSALLPAASLTKVVAIHAALVAEARGEVDLGASFRPPAESWAENQPPGSSLMFLGPNQVLTGRELLSGLAISSGNDAAIALALLVDGSVTAFAERMNRTVREFGLARSTFVEPSGLSPGNVTTAYEYAVFLREHFAAFPGLLESLYSLGSYTYPAEDNIVGDTPYALIRQNNRNLLLESYPGVDGVKTGFIDESGYHLAATAERDGRRLIAVVLGIDADTHAEGGALRAADAAALLDYGYDDFELLRFTPPPLASVRVFRGKPSELTPDVAGTIAVSVPAGRRDDLDGRVDQLTRIIAPVAEASQVGSVAVFLDGVALGREPILLPQIEEGGFLRRLWDTLVMFFSSIFGRDKPLQGKDLEQVLYSSSSLGTT